MNMAEILGNHDKLKKRNDKSILAENDKEIRLIKYMLKEFSNCLITFFD